MDSTEEGSWEGMAALMARQADALHAKASLKNVRVDDLKAAARHLRQSADAIARGDIRQAREFRKLAMAALERAHAELEAGPSGGMDAEARLTQMLEGVVEGGADEAPPKYRDAVSEYFKQLNESF